MDLPTLRPVRAFPVEDEGERRIALEDPEGIADSIALSLEAFFIASLLDGAHSLLDVQTAYVQQFGQILLSERVEELVERLDESYFLETERFEGRRRQVLEAYRAADVREAVHAGSSYPDDAETLGAWIDAFYTASDGPGLPGSGEGDPVRAVVSPHAAPRRAGASYARAYHALLGGGPADVYVVLGSAHRETGAVPFALTRKAYRTPLGTLGVAGELLEALEDGLDDPAAWYEAELAHRDEHAIEHEVLFLQHALGEEAGDARLLPILCGDLDRWMDPGRSPGDDELHDAFCRALREAADGFDGTVAFVAGADLSHVGRAHGDPLGVSETLLRALEVADRRSVDAATRGDAEAFYRTIEAEKNRRKVCGLAPIYALLRTLDPGEGELLGYEQSVDEETDSVTTFASIAWG